MPKPSLLSPGAYYAAGLAPIDIYVEDPYVRACPGGTGFTKCGGNYAVSLLAGLKAEEKGYSQVLWLDSQERKYVEEVGLDGLDKVLHGDLGDAEAVVGVVHAAGVALRAEELDFVLRGAVGLHALKALLGVAAVR